MRSPIPGRVCVMNEPDRDAVPTRPYLVTFKDSA